MQHGKSEEFTVACRQAGRQAGSVCCSMHKYISLKTVPIAALAPQQSAHWQAAANITQHMQAQLWNLL
jgi:hypothetical protein